MRIKALKKTALSSLSGNWGKSIGVIIVLFLISAFVPTFVEIALTGDVTQWLEQGTTPLWVEAVVLAVQVALIPLYFGAYVYFVTLVRQNDATFDLAFKGLTKQYYLKTLLTGVLMSIYVFLWALLLIIPGIIKAFSYSQTYYILKDRPDLRPNQAITESRRLMKGYKWKYFMTLLSFIGWFFVAVFTLGIGFIWLIPYIYATIAAFYDELRNQNVPESEAV
ncbi:DUF975 family protein [Alteribacter keqinensis]|uniref:DUF975 family protein n=1 Tax=Alteribacter keqinensis TaxID=2483800 RepID=UPI00160632B5|nr:DUF975 family protein [Alteribacter keqinensis]